MKTMFRWILFVCGFAAITFESQATEPSVGWLADFAAAQSLAREQQLPLVVHFHASWCGPCKSMERAVLSQAATLSMLGKQVIGVKVDSDAERDLVRRFSVTSLPTDLFLDAQGNEVARTVGTQELSSYLRQLKSLAEGRSAPAPSTAATRAPRQPDSYGTTTLRLVLRPSDATPPSEVDTPPSALTTVDAKNGNSTQELAAVDQSGAVLASDIDADGYRLGLAGFSPVALAADQSWTKGEESFTAEFLGVRYRFASDEEAKSFRRQPDAFVPCLHGFDPVLLRDRKTLTIGQLEYRAVHQQRVYFFASAENRRAFTTNPSRYTDQKELLLFRRQPTATSDDSAE